MGPRRRKTHLASRSKGRLRRIRASKRLRIAVLATGIAAAAILVTIGLTGLSSQSGRIPASESVRPSRTQSSGEGGAADKILSPAEIGNGFAFVDGGNQGIPELISRLPQDRSEQEAQRLRDLGFVEGAITIAYKASSAPGPLTDTAVTVQILRFQSPAGAEGQLRYDAQGGLVTGFDISEPYEQRSDYRPEGVPPSPTPGVLILKSPPAPSPAAGNDDSSPGEGSFVVIAAIARDVWEIVVEVRAPSAPALSEIDRILALQYTKIGL